MARDSQRAKVYAAEEFVRTLFDRAGEHGNRSVKFFGASLTLPPGLFVQRVVKIPRVATRGAGFKAA